MKILRRFCFFAVVVCLTQLVFSSSAQAQNTKTLDYSFDQIWSTAIRFIRVDRGYPIREKDQENGFVLFVYPGEGSVKECAGALEIVPIVDENGYQRVRLQLDITHQPSYIAVKFLDDLEQKLFDEQGRAPAPRKPQRPGPPKENDKSKKDPEKDDKSKDKSAEQ